MNRLVEGTVQVWHGDRLLAPSEYDVDYTSGVVTLYQSTQEGLEVAIQVVPSPRPLRSNLRKQEAELLRQIAACRSGDATQPAGASRPLL